jgi:hypothetical protein
MRFIDYFPYFDPYGKELLELRIRLLENHVEQFIICESNRTQSGVPIEYTLEKRIHELGLPHEKIKIIQLDIPADELLDIQEIDLLNSYETNRFNLNSIRARTRERMQKDALLQVIDDYDDDIIFIHSDSDEIIKPELLPWAKSYVDMDQKNALKIPLVHLEGRPDFQVCHESTGEPVEWLGMFMCYKNVLKIATPSQIRGQVLCPVIINFPTTGNEMVREMGWHFSWMGGKDSRLIKSKSFTHYDDTFGYLTYSQYKSEANQIHLSKLKLEEGQPTAAGTVGLILKKYPIENLPPEIFSIDRVRKFLLEIDS